MPRTRLTLPQPRIGLGLAALGRPGYINLGHGEDMPDGRDVEAMRAHCHAMLETAWRHGIRYVDAARSYGRAEAFLGDWLAGRPADERPVVGSKWGYTYTAGWQVDADVHEVKEHSREVLDRQWGETLEALGFPPALYQIHSATLDSGVLDNAAVLDRLGELRDQGVAIGLTTSGPAQAETLARAMAVEIDGRPLFDAVQATANLFEPSVLGQLEQASQAGMAVIIKEAVANGRLTARNDRAGDASALQTLDAVAGRHGVGRDALAIGWLLDHPFVDMVLSGAGSEAQLAANLRALDVTLAPADREALAGLAERPQDYWRTRGGLDWN
ncbi:aldo/keto reductase [Guyparkeria hydrothermalis]|uniref:aldo/keto reductase n=1 Tax=Guyparkeria TaxID=2035712 RepID=UPI0010AC0225|nr:MULTISPECIES: aldo/keto reductase [Guyparkeria]MCL7750587.1 aldo/keto reductase [Guyparkeria hydrothermalis]TKA88608.1 aldo/keto reductase [Guyparkeria sp. SB14A]